VIKFYSRKARHALHALHSLTLRPCLALASSQNNGMASHSRHKRKRALVQSMLPW